MASNNALSSKQHHINGESTTPSLNMSPGLINASAKNPSRLPPIQNRGMIP
jgi:hypothetical protein